jgi:hypothetical protein
LAAGIVLRRGGSMAGGKKLTGTRLRAILATIYHGKITGRKRGQTRAPLGLLRGQRWDKDDGWLETVAATLCKGSASKHEPQWEMREK